VDWTRPKTVYAVWAAKVFTVTLDATGGTATSPAQITVTFAQPYGTLPTTTRTGYVFDGWFTDATGGTQVTSTSTVTNPADHTLYAHWHPAAGIVLNLDKNATDATAGTPAQYDDLTYGQTLTAQGKTLPTPGSGAPTRTGYDFIGWASSRALASAGTSDFTAGALVDWTTAKTVYAVWQAKTLYVTFDATGGVATSPAGITVTFAQPYGALPTTTRTGYVFDGWADAPSGGTQVTSATVVANAANHTLYARWHSEDDIVLIFDKNAADATAGTPALWADLVFDQALAAQGKALPTPGSGAPTRTGYDFVGWASSSALASAGTADLTDGTLVDWTSATSKTAYAVWAPKAVDVHFFNNYTAQDTSQYALGNAANTSRRFTDRLSPFSAPVRAGYVFNGWYDARSGGGLWDFDAWGINVYPTLNLYAHWTLIPTITVTPPSVTVTLPPSNVVVQGEVTEGGPLMIGVTPGSAATISTPETPTSAAPAEVAQGHWALMNLNLTIVVAFLLVLLLTDRKRKGAALRAIAVVATVASIVIFLLTQDLTQPMELVDTWTISHLAIVLIQAVVWFLAKNREDEQEQEQEQTSA
jgi:uncharacterized repeat protein (TIGR02543 family)